MACITGKHHCIALWPAGVSHADESAALAAARGHADSRQHLQVVADCQAKVMLSADPGHSEQLALKLL